MKLFNAHIKSWLGKAFNTSVLQKTRMPWVDYLRGIAIILVVYRHVLLGIDRSGIVVPSILENANMVFYSFRMPLFFILSGIFISSSLVKKTLKQLISIKFENLLYPYFIWAFLQITLQIVLTHFTNSSRTLVDYSYILYQPRSLDQFWYLPALFNTTVIYLLIKTKLKPPVWMQFVIGLMLYFLSPFCQNISMISDWMEFYIFFALGDSISRLFFTTSVQNFLKNRFTLLLLAPFFVAAQIYYLRNNVDVGNISFLLVSLIGCLTMFVLAFKMQKWNVLKFLRVLGYHSLYIYVMHVMVAALIRILFTKFFGIFNPVILLISGITFGVIVPVMVYNLFIKNNVGWFLFSFHKNKKISQPVKERTSAAFAS